MATGECWTPPRNRKSRPCPVGAIAVGDAAFRVCTFLRNQFRHAIEEGAAKRRLVLLSDRQLCLFVWSSCVPMCEFHALAMSHSYICTTCRIRLLLSKPPRVGTQQRAWISQASPQKQEAQRVVDRSLGSGRRVQALLERDPHSEPKSRQISENVARGRYSGQVLRPEQLLHELDQPRQAQRNDQQGRPEAHRPRRYESQNISNTVAKRTRRSQSSDPSQLAWKLRGMVLRGSGSDPELDKDVWITLKDVIGVKGGCEALKNLGHDFTFRRAYYYWTVRVTKSWTEALRATATPDSKTYVEASALETLPSPLQVLRLWHYFSNQPSRGIWTHVLWLLAKDVAEIYVPHAEASKAVPASVTVGLRQLMSIWSLCLSTWIHSRNPIAASEDSISLDEILAPPTYDWSFLPNAHTFAESLQYNAAQRGTRVSFSDALSMLGFGVQKFARTPESVEEDEQKEIYDAESAAIVTLDLLQSIKSLRGGANMVEDFEPWTQLLEASLKNVTSPTVPTALARRMMQMKDDDPVTAYYRAIIMRHDLDTTSIENGEARKTGEDGRFNGAAEGQYVGPSGAVEGMPQLLNAASDTSSEPADPTKRFAHLSIKRLERALEQQDLRAVERVRRDMLEYVSRNPDLQPPQALYEHMIYAFLCLRSLPIGIEIWNQMIKAGYRPRNETFTVMMKGSQHLRDLTSMEHFWNKMRQAGVQPDPKAWSTRIYGLMRKGHTDAGLRALAEMGHDWLVAAKAAYERDYPSNKKKKGAPDVTASDLLARFERDIDNVPRPDVVIMNSAISPLATGRDRLIPKILTWGRSFGIEPDLSTYNALLNVSMRHGMVDEALNIFRRMKERNIEADSTTWTVLLTAMFEGGFVDDLAPEQQEARVLEFISSLESMSASAIDQKGYALIMDRLLKTYGNPQAAQAVLAHMSARGVEPNVHMYTILMASYFQQSPPNFAAAEGLWAHIQSSRGGYGAALDTVFYDRMIESYATHHALVGTAPMLTFLARMESEGKKPSWRAMEQIARTLAETGEWTRLAQIVDKTRRRLREEKGGDTRHGQKDFWRFVISTGMLRHEGIQIPEHIMGTTVEDPLQRVQGLQGGQDAWRRG